MPTVISSRGIERLCRDHVTFIALCGDTAPHFTTIAEFVSTVGDDIARVFAAVVAICDAQGLIGREMFAIDGVKLSSNASKARSGTRADFERQATKLEATVQQILARHRASDQLPTEPTLTEKETKRVERLERDAAQIRAWLAANPEDRAGVKGGVRKSNRTDNESAKMATGKGVIQGYTGVAAVDAAHQIIVEAQAHGTGSEQELLLPIVTAIQPLLAESSVITADAGYHSERNLAQLDAAKIDALIADNDMRRRDERFATAEHHATSSPLHSKSTAPTRPRRSPRCSRRARLRTMRPRGPVCVRRARSSNARAAIACCATISGRAFPARSGTADRVRSAPNACGIPRPPQCAR